MTSAEKRKLIKKAYNYNSHARNMASCNHMYMGSLATCILYSKLNADWPNVSLNEALKKASDEQLTIALDYCQPYLKY